jgi:hypothetical protein
MELWNYECSSFAYNQPINTASREKIGLWIDRSLLIITAAHSTAGIIRCIFYGEKNSGTGTVPAITPVLRTEKHHRLPTEKAQALSRLFVQARQLRWPR